MLEPIRLAVLISGGGTTLQNLIDRIADGRLAARIAGVVSSRADAFGIQRAKKAGLPVAVVEKGTPDRVWNAVRGFNAQLVCLAGWLNLLPIPVDFRRKVLNIHPALLPAFGGKGMYGLRVHEAALAAGVMVSGCTVHFADDTYDTGPILVQKCVPVLADDTADSLAARVFAAECEAYPEAIRLIAEGKVRIAGTGPP
ncbi:MAG TPA: phosphoribosylglycinamide formyltransferase [Urbifossiella sp.]|nr:phosphoribosylglycinamide formyltransferase [Urbifossiella sp.]